MSDTMTRILREADEALSPSNARTFDGDSNFKKCLDLKVCVVGDPHGHPLFVLEARSPRSAVNNLGLSILWSTNDRVEAAAFLRTLANKIEEH